MRSKSEMKLSRCNKKLSLPTQIQVSKDVQEIQPTYSKHMKKFFVLVMVIATTSIFATGQAEASAKKYSSCAQLRKAFPRGVATSKAKVKKTKAAVSRNVYRSNRHLDTNNNGVACEKGEKKAKPAAGTFGEGTKRVGGAGIAPGRYVTTSTGSCYWARLSGFGGSFEEILTNDFNSGRNHLVVDILPSDAGFTSRGCGTWAPFLATGPKSITNGTWVVGDALLPGIWTSTPTESCYWARLSGFSGSFTEIITNEFTYESSIVEIASTDAGFKTNGCGTWTKIS